MTATCQLCGATITGPQRVAMLLNPGTDPAAAKAVAEISEFDLLAGRVSQHMEIHQDQAMEMAAIMHLSGKVYAMTWVECPTDPEFRALREAWRSGILTMLQSTSKPVAVEELPDQADAAVVLPAGLPGVSSGTPEGSNEQNSARKERI